jgi:hypothetical protein
VVSALVLPPGEPNLVVALLAASKFKGAGYVHRYDGVAGWYVSQRIPRGVAAYFRVVAHRVYGRDDVGNEYLFGQIVDGVIVPAKP